jgi:hypothetical protein
MDGTAILAAPPPTTKDQAMASDVTKEIARLLGGDPICNGRVTMDTVEAIAALVADATAIERERCALVARPKNGGCARQGEFQIRCEISAAIRKGPTA